jgi:hypothetical protein
MAQEVGFLAWQAQGPDPSQPTNPPKKTVTTESNSKAENVQVNMSYDLQEPFHAALFWKRCRITTNFSVHSHCEIYDF